MARMSMIRNAAALGFVLVVGTACASAGPQTVGTAQSAVPGGDAMEQAAIPACGDRIDALPGRTEGLSVTGEFPARVDRGGNGMFAGTVTVTSTGARVSGITTPEADVYVATAGKVVATPLPKDLIGQMVDLSSGASQAFTARGTIQQCAAGAGGLLPAGHYEVFAVVVVNRDDGPAVVVAGGPWPLEVT
jgi:hypothetical protein